MAHISTRRHQSIFDSAENNPPIHIIGAGATGSRVFLSLVELGLTNISVYDFDQVEPHNLANQTHLHQHIGEYKVYALEELYFLKTGHPPPDTMKFINKKVCAENFTPEDFTGIVFLLTDTMASRREIWYDLLSKGSTWCMIETRMASSYGDVKVVNPFDPTEVQNWINSLVGDADAEVSPCGASISVGPTAAIIANLAVWQMIHFLTDEHALDRSMNIHMKPMMLTLEKT